MPPTLEGTGESGGPTANPCDLGWVVHGLRICTGMGGSLWECGAVIWVDELWFSACRGLLPGSFAQCPAQGKLRGLEEQQLL